MCKRHQRAVPNKQKVLVFSKNNSSSNIYKISVVGKGKYYFHRHNNKIVKLNFTTQIKKAVTVSTGFGKKEFLRVQRNQQSFLYIEFLLTRNNFCN